MRRGRGDHHRGRLGLTCRDYAVDRVAHRQRRVVEQPGEAQSKNDDEDRMLLLSNLLHDRRIEQSLTLICDCQGGVLLHTPYRGEVSMPLGFTTRAV